MTIAIVLMDNVTVKHIWEASIGLNGWKKNKGLEVEGDILGKGTRMSGKEGGRGW